MTRDSPRTLVTGSTGYLGAEIAVRLLASGRRCLLLVRPDSLERARKLFHEDLARGRAEILSGDITLPGCGVDLATARVGVDDAVHLAALPRFHGYDRKTMFATNAEGTLNAFHLARDLGARSFFHFSTAFVAGKHTGLFSEDDADVGQDFRNFYEESKLQAEILLRDAARLSSLAVTVLRPSIVVGDGRAGRGRGLFGVIEILGWLKERLDSIAPSRRHRFELELPGDPRVELNLIPLQTVAEMFLRVHAEPRLWGGTYHLTNAAYTPIDELRGALSSMIGIDGIEWATGPDAEGTPRMDSPLAKAFLRKLRPYFPYFLSEPRWSRTRLEAAIPDWLDLSGDSLQRMLGGEPDPAAAPSGERLWVDRYFSDFIPRRTADPAFTAVRSLNDLVGIQIAAEGIPHRLVRFEHGRFQGLEQDERGPVRCVFQLDLATFARIVGGEIAPQSAFFEKQVRVRGDIFFALKLGSLLEGFFRRHPYPREGGIA